MRSAPPAPLRLPRASPLPPRRSSLYQRAGSLCADFTRRSRRASLRFLFQIDRCRCSIPPPQQPCISLDILSLNSLLAVWIFAARAICSLPGLRPGAALEPRSRSWAWAGLRGGVGLRPELLGLPVELRAPAGCAWTVLLVLTSTLTLSKSANKTLTVVIFRQCRS